MSSLQKILTLPVISISLLFNSAEVFCQTFLKTYGGTGTEHGHAVYECSNGDLLIIGTTNEAGSVAGGTDIMLTRTDASGNVIWQKAYGGSGNDYGIGADVIETSDGGLLFTGGTNSFTTGNIHYIPLVKTDGTGNILWQKLLTTTNTSSGNDHGRVVFESSTNHYYVPGTTNSSSGYGNSDALLLKYDALGNVIWTKHYGATNNQHFIDMRELPNGDLVLCGNTQSQGPGIRAGTLMRVDSSGAIVWQKSFGGTGIEAMLGMCLSSDLEIYTVGFTTSFGAGSEDFYLTKFDTAGNHIWTKTYGGSSDDQGKQIVEMQDGSLSIYGSTESFGNGSTDHIIINIDTAGNLNWSQTIGTTAADPSAQGAKMLYCLTNGDLLFTGSINNGTNGFDILLGRGTINTLICSPATPIQNAPTVTISTTAFNHATIGTVSSITLSTNTPPGLSQFFCPCPFVATFPTDANICVGDSTLLTAGGGVTYQWTPSIGLACDTCASTMASPPTTQTYLVTVYDGACVDTSTVTVFVDTNLISVITNPGNICENQSTFYMNATPGGGSWSGPGIINSLGWFAPSLVGPGSHQVVYNPPGVCASNDTLLVTVLQYLDPVITPVNTICEDTGVFNLSVSTTGGIWSGTGIIDPVNGTFDPSVSGTGTFLISYSHGGALCTEDDSILITVLPYYVLSIDSVSAFCETDSSIFLTASPSGGVWSGPGIIGSSTGEFNPSILTPGTFEIIYSMPNSCAENDTVLITILPTIIAQITGPDTICETDPSFSFTGSPAGGTWSGTGIIDPVNGTFDPVVSGPGSFPIIYNLTTACPVDDTTAIIVLPYLTISIDSIGPLCENGPDINLTATPIGGSWSGPGITNPATGLFAPSNLAAGVYDVIYSVPFNCAPDDTVQIVILPAQIAQITAQDTLCVNETSIVLSATPAGGTWSGNGITNAASGTFDPFVAGVGTATIVYILPLPCSVPDTISIVVTDTTYIPPTLPDFCVNDGTFILPAGNWSGPGVTAGNPATFSPLLAGVGTFNLSLYTGNPCIGTITVPVTVNPTPYFNLGSDTTICYGCSLVLNPGVPGLNYIWFDNSSSGTYTATGTGFYSVTGTNIFDCVFSDQIYIGVECDYNLYIPNAFTPNGDGKNDFFIPIAYNINDYSIQIFNRWGQLIWETDDLNAGWTGHYNGSMCADGIYTYQVTYTPCGLTRTEHKKGHITLLK